MSGSQASLSLVLRFRAGPSQIGPSRRLAVRARSNRRLDQGRNHRQRAGSARRTARIARRGSRLGSPRTTVARHARHPQPLCQPRDQLRPERLARKWLAVGAAWRNGAGQESRSMAANRPGPGIPSRRMPPMAVGRRRRSARRARRPAFPPVRRGSAGWRAGDRAVPDDARLWRAGGIVLRRAPAVAGRFGANSTPEGAGSLRAETDRSRAKQSPRASTLPLSHESAPASAAAPRRRRGPWLLRWRRRVSECAEQSWIRLRQFGAPSSVLRGSTDPAYRSNSAACFDKSDNLFSTIEGEPARAYLRRFG